MTIKAKTKVGRNDPCPCKSGLKFKQCHGDAVKQMLCNRVANEHMVHLIREEQIKHGLIKLPWLCNGCGKQFEVPNISTVAELDICPFCDSTDISLQETE